MSGRIAQFLGYVSEDLEGKSAYDYHHILDNDVVLKSYKTRTAFHRFDRYHFIIIIIINIFKHNNDIYSFSIFQCLEM